MKAILLKWMHYMCMTKLKIAQFYTLKYLL